VVNSQTSTSEREKIRAQLVAHQIPDSIITRISSGESVSDAELISLSLTYDQRLAAADAQRAVAVQNIPGGSFLSIASILITVASFVGGLLGWLLIMRKRILQCTHCGAVVPAS